MEASTGLRLLLYRLERVIDKKAGRDEIESVHRELRSLLVDLLTGKEKR